MCKDLVVIGLCGLFFLSGCTLMQMNRDSDARESRIPIKQQQLFSQDQQNQALMAQQKQLESQRSQIQGKENELNRTLESSSQRTAQMKAVTQQQKRKQQEIEARIRKIKAEKEALQAQPDTDAKRQKLEALQNEADQLFALPLGKGSVK